MKLTEYQKLINQHRKEFDIYYQELISYNEKVNLTAITEVNEVFTKHFLDSIISVDAIPINSNVVDIGTGAGFPSLPIKIVRPDINLTMVDSLNKRINFLNLVCDKLNIKSNNIHSRAEDFAKNNREKFDIAVARAVAKLNTLLEYLLPLVKVGGFVIAYKGSNFQEELNEAQNALNMLGGKLLETIKLNLPNEQGERCLLIIEKVKPTDKKYPRGGNQPKLKPIV